MLIMLYGRRDADIALWVQEADIALKMFLIINGKALQMNRFVLHSIYCILFIMFTIGFMQYEYNALIRGFKLHSTPPPYPFLSQTDIQFPFPLPSYPFLYQTDIKFPYPPPIPSYTRPIYSSPPPPSHIPSYTKPVYSSSPPPIPSNTRPGWLSGP